ncbi:MAG: T9SS type A sorting domain-containing protein [Chitinophagaceae bacterium]
MNPIRLLIAAAFIFICGISFAQSPGGITGAQLWLRADAGTGTTTDGTNVLTWTDQSGSGNNATHSVSYTTPYTFVAGVPNANFNPYMKFTGVSSFFTLPSGFANFTGGLSFFSAAQYTAANNNGCMLMLSAFTTGGTDDIGFDRKGTTSDIEAFSYIGTTAHSAFSSGGTGIINNVRTLYDYVAPGGTAGTATTISSNVNGASVTMGAGFYVPNNVTRIKNVLGAYGTGVTLFNGNMGDVLLYNKNLSASERIRVQSYLALKYGTTLNNGATTYIASDGTTPMWTADATFKYRVFGIGTDNGSALAQQASTDNTTSVSGTITGLVTIATANDFAMANNLRSAGTKLADGKFITISDDNKTIATNTTLKPVAAVSTVGRNWKLQSNNSTSFYLQFNANNTGNVFPALTTGQTYALVYTTNSSADYTSNTTIVSLTKNGNLLTTPSGVTIPANAIFTVAIMPPSPGGVIGAVLWNKADAGTTGTSPVTQWVSQSGTNAFSKGGSGTPVLEATGVNFNPDILFDGNSYFQGNTSVAGISEVFAVGKMTAPGAGSASGAILSDNASNTTYAFHLEGNTFYASSSPGNSISFSSPGNFPLSIMNVSNPSTMYINGAIKSTTGIGTGFTTMPAITPMIAARPGNVFLAGGKICEIISYSTALTATGRQQVHSYLATKYGFSLPTDYISPNAGTYYATTTTNSGYANDITAIGKETTQALDQEQSFSQSASFPVYIGAGSDIAASNSAHASSLPDNAYLAFGNNAGSTTLATSLITGYNAMARIWKVQQTGTVGTVMIAVPLSLFANFSTTANCVAMATSTNSGFTAGTYTQIATTGIVKTINGTPCVTFLKDFSDGQYYFTFMQGTTNYTATVASSGTSVSASNSGCYTSDGWTVYSNGNNKYLGIYTNGNSFTQAPAVTISNNNSNAAMVSGNNATALSSNMYTIDNSINGSPSYANDMKVRVYYNPADLQAALDNAAAVTANPAGNTMSKWFKFEGNAAAVAAAQQTSGIAGAQYLTPVLGTEGGLNYAEFSGIKNFSTFGFMAYNTQLQTLLGIKLLYFNGTRQGSNNLLQWKLADTINFKQFKLQRAESSNGSFSTIANIAATNSQSNYNYTDAGRNTGAYYRIAMIDADGMLTYTNVLYIAASGLMQTVRVSPNPALSGHAVTITLNGYTAGATGRLYDGNGRLLNTTKLINGSNTVNTNGLTKGIYNFIITDTNGNAHSEKIVVL